MLKPIGDNILVQKIENDSVSKGGIFIPEVAKERPTFGKVLARGPGSRNVNGAYIAMDVQVGDVVVFGKFSGSEIKINTQTLYIMKEADIMGIYEG